MTAHGVRGHFCVRSPRLRTASSDISAADKSEADKSAAKISAADMFCKLSALDKSAADMTCKEKRFGQKRCEHECCKPYHGSCIVPVCLVHMLATYKVYLDRSGWTSPFLLLPTMENLVQPMGHAS